MPLSTSASSKHIPSKCEQACAGETVQVDELERARMQEKFQLNELANLGMQTQDSAAGFVNKSPLGRAGRATQFIFLFLFALVVLLPCVGMLWAPTLSTSENRTLASFPALFEAISEDANVSDANTTDADDAGNADDAGAANDTAASIATTDADDALACTTTTDADDAVDAGDITSKITNIANVASTSETGAASASETGSTTGASAGSTTGTATGAAENTTEADISTASLQLNVDFLQDLGNYFEDHFAYRNFVVAANAYLRSTLFGVSSSSSVVVGSNGWLYYEGTLADYQASDSLSQRELDNIAFNLSLIQSYCKAQDAQFVFAVAPDKNALYDENMPYYIRSYNQDAISDLEQLASYLDKYQVNYANLLSAFSGEIEEAAPTLYYERDSHWNTLGAAFASQQILQIAGYSSYAEQLARLVASALQDEETNASDVSDLANAAANADTTTSAQGSGLSTDASTSTRYSMLPYVGDLNSMLYPEWSIPELDYDFDTSSSYTFVTGSESTNAWIETQALQVQTSLDVSLGESSDPLDNDSASDSSEALNDASLGMDAELLSDESLDSVSDASFVSDASSSLLMYRDSFANNMLQFLSSQFDTAYYSKYVPYDLSQVNSLKPQLVVIERAQRHLATFNETPAIMPAPSVNLSAQAYAMPYSSVSSSPLEISVSKNGNYTVLEGEIPEVLQNEDASIYISISTSEGTSTYVPFHVAGTSSAYGFRAFISGDIAEDATIDVMVVSDKQSYKLASRLNY